MRIIIIGSVAAGTSVAAKARRNNIENEIVIYEKDNDISYSSCGLPYYIGEDYIERGNITSRDAKWFKKRFNIDIFTGHEVIDIDYNNKEIKVKNLASNEIIIDKFDKLVFATGAKTKTPNIKGIEKVKQFHLKNVNNADEIKNYIENNNVNKALIIGSGFIGLELLDNLAKKNINTTIIEFKNHLMPNLDEDMSIYIEKYLDEKKIDYLLNDSVEEFLSDKKAITKNNKTIEFDMVIFATGITPNVELAKKIGVNLGKYNGILVNDYMETNLKDIYAVGDCCEHKFRLTGDYIYRPLGSTANKMGRIAGENITGIKREFKGILGTGIFKVFDLAVGQTGLTEREARKLGDDIEIIHNIKEDKSKYLKESKEIVIKAIADRKTQKLLGVQIVGEAGVDKRVDVFATLITYNVPVGDFFNLDLAYAPPFATTKDPVLYTGMILDNALNRGRKILTPNVLIENRDKYKVIDVRSKKDYDKGHIEEAYHIPLAELESRLDEFDKEENIAVHCNKGVTGNAAQNLLINHGFKNVYNISGGYKNYKIQKDYLYK